MNCWLMILEDFMQTIIEYLNKQYRIFSHNTHVSSSKENKREGEAFHSFQTSIEYIAGSNRILHARFYNKRLKWKKEGAPNYHKQQQLNHCSAYERRKGEVRARVKSVAYTFQLGHMASKKLHYWITSRYAQPS